MMNKTKLINLYFDMEETIYKRICQRCLQNQTKNKTDDRAFISAKEKIIEWSRDVL